MSAVDGGRRRARVAARSARSSRCASPCSACSRSRCSAIIFFRLWYLQVLSGDQYLRQARDNHVRELAHRRRRAARSSTATASCSSRTASRPSSSSTREQLPERRARRRAPTWGQQVDRCAHAPRRRATQGAADRRCPRPPTPQLRLRFERLGARRSGMSARDDPASASSARSRSCPYAQRHGQDRRARDGARLPARAPASSSPASTSSRSTCAATRSSDARPPSSWARSARSARASSSCARFRGVAPGHVVGKDGHRARLRPLPARHRRRQRIRSTRSAGPKGQRAGARRRGRAAPCELSLDLDLQQAGQQALRQAIATAARARPGAFVALDPRNGEVLAMGSDPTLRPGDPRRGRSPRSAYDAAASGRHAGSPLFNRAIGGRYPTGSTFKPITALRRRCEPGMITPSTPINDPGLIKIGAASSVLQRRRGGQRHA